MQNASSGQDSERDKDIANRIPRLYRVFDLVNEQESGGLGEVFHRLEISTLS